MSLKKQLKEQVKGGVNSRVLDESQQEMNELIDSEPEVNAGDVDESGGIYDGGSSVEEDYEFNCDELSLIDSDEERDQLKKAKANQAKINNSFTGPYPLDPTDFNHTDKGPNN